MIKKLYKKTIDLNYHDQHGMKNLNYVLGLLYQYSKLFWVYYPKVWDADRQLPDTNLHQQNSE